MSPSNPLVAGVDGCPAGWIAVVGSLSEKEPWLAFAPSFADLVKQHPRVARWAVDIPIGLADDGPRECDQLVRKRLGPNRGSSVFPAPPRAVADYAANDGNDYVEACQLAAAATGKKISKQAWNITPKIAEVRKFLSETPRLRKRIFECHPELCFAQLAGGEAIAEGKKTLAGHQQRRRLLNAVVGAACVNRLVIQTEATRSVGVDDTLDALACWTAAARAAQGESESFPAAAQRDADGLEMAIVW